MLEQPSFPHCSGLHRAGAGLCPTFAGDLNNLNGEYNCFVKVVRDPGCPGTDKLILLYTRTENKNAREVFAECDKSKLRRLLIALVARTELGKEGDNYNEDDVDDVARRNGEDAQCGGSDGRAGSPGKASSSATGPPRTETRESIPLIDD